MKYYREPSLERCGLYRVRAVSNPQAKYKNTNIIDAYFSVNSVPEFQIIDQKVETFI